MARRRNSGKGNTQNQNQKKAGGSNVKKQGFGSDLKPTRCSKCRFNKAEEPCYKKRKLLTDLEYVECVPAMIHYPYKKLVQTGLIES